MEAMTFNATWQSALQIVKAREGISVEDAVAETLKAFCAEATPEELQLIYECIVEELLEMSNGDYPLQGEKDRVLDAYARAAVEMSKKRKFVFKGNHSIDPKVVYTVTRRYLSR